MTTPSSNVHPLTATDSSNRNRRLLELPEVMDLVGEGDVVYSLKVWAMAFRIIADFVIDEFEDKELSADVLQICEDALRPRPLVSARRLKSTKRRVMRRRQDCAFEGGPKPE